MKSLALLLFIMALIVLFFGPDTPYFVVQRSSFFVIFLFWSAGSFFYSSKEYKGGIVSIVGMVCLGISIYGITYALFIMNYSTQEEVIANILIISVFLILGTLFMRVGHARHKKLIICSNTENQTENVSRKKRGCGILLRSVALGVLGLLLGSIIGQWALKLTEIGFNKVVLFVVLFLVVGGLVAFYLMPIERRYWEKLEKIFMRDNENMLLKYMHETSIKLAPFSFFVLVGMLSAIVFG